MAAAATDGIGMFPGMKAPDFEGLALKEGKIQPFSFSSLKGAPVLLVFYPIDFDYIAPTELSLLQTLKKSNHQIVAVSTSSCLSKSAWSAVPLESGGIKDVDFPLVQDLDQKICKLYGVTNQDRGYSFRAFFIIDSEGIVAVRSVTDLPVGLRIRESLRLLDAVATGAYTLPDWQPGDKTIDPERFSLNDFHGGFAEHPMHEVQSTHHQHVEAHVVQEAPASKGEGAHVVQEAPASKGEPSHQSANQG